MFAFRNLRRTSSFNVAGRAILHPRGGMAAFNTNQVSFKT